MPEERRLAISEQDITAEATGTQLPTFADQLQCKGRVDIPMGKSWNANVPYDPIQRHHIPDRKEAASAVMRQ